MTNDVDAEAIAAAARSALPYAHPNDLAPLLAAIGDAQFVCLGESTHGTREFYELRAEITRRLVAEKGFSVVLVEGEWPAGSRVNRFISGVSLDTSAEAALASFEGFPKWMWRNAPTARLAEDLRQHNARARAERREQDDARAALEAMRAGGATNEQLEEAGLPRSLIEAGPCDGRPTDASFYGMDVYSVNASAAAVLEFLDIVDPEAASSACARYSVLSEYGDDMKRYGYESTRGIMASRSDEIQSGLVQVLADLQRQNREAYALMMDPAELLNAEQNAQVVVNGENYFRGLWESDVGSVATWNLRDQHMVQTCLRLLEYHQTMGGTGGSVKMVLWAHNSHVGDATATELSVREEWNLGQMMRTTFGAEAVFLCGFGTHSGQVTAAHEWGGEASTFELSRAEDGSHEALMHEALLQVRERQAS